LVEVEFEVDFDGKYNIYHSYSDQRQKLTEFRDTQNKVKE
jgi:hypothetical protein